MYNVTTLTNCNDNLVCMLQTINGYCEGLLGIGIVVMIWFVAYSRFVQDNEPLDAAMGSSIIATVVSILFLILEIITYHYMFIPVIATAVCYYGIHNRTN